MDKLWFRVKITSININSLLLAATSIRNNCEKLFRKLADDAKQLSGFERKRCIPKLRYCAGRLMYLVTDDTLKSLAEVASQVPELHLYAEIMKTLYTGQIDNILPLGVNAAQMAAKPLKAANKIGLLTKLDLSPSEQHVLSIFFLHGINISIPENTPSEYSDILRFAITGSDSKLMKQLDNPILRELACLHGIGSPRHSITLETAFDIDEDLDMDMDALEQPWQSS